MKRHAIGIVSALYAIGLASGAFAAQEPQSAPTLVYTLRTSGSGSQMPGGPGTAMTIAFTLENTDADGTRHGSVLVKMTGIGNAMQPAKIDAAISPAGAISLKYDPAAMRPHMGMSKAEVAAASAGSQAAMLQFQLAPFNAFASACAAQKTLRPGASWRATSSELPPMDLAYAVTGRASHSGRDTLAVTMQGTMVGGSGAVSGQGYYDPADRVVAGMHYEMKSPDGRQGEIVDIDLAPKP